MRKIFFTPLFSLLLMSLQAQEIAVTERGDSVVLYSNGTWDYYDNYRMDYRDQEGPVIPFSDKTYKKPGSANKKVNGMNDAYEIWYDAKEWRRIPAGDINPEADVAFQAQRGDVYSMVIYEELEIPLANLSDIALENALSVAPDMQIIEREYRIVNSDTIVFMRMDGTTQGMKISYYSYYYTDEDGSIQFHTFTGQSLLNKYKEKIEDLLNGFMNK